MREIVLEAPGKNALSTAVMESLRAQVESAGGEPLLLTGAGDVFSAGLDLKEVAAITGVEDTRRLIGALERLVEALFLYPGPTVAAVNGHAIAGGCVLALCCDRRVMTSRPGVRVGLNEVALGLAFPPRTFAMIRAQLPAPQAERLMLGAELHEAAAAPALGLVEGVAEDARAAAATRLEALARLPRDAYARAKAALRGGALTLSTEDERRFEAETLPLWSTAAPAAARRALGR